MNLLFLNALKGLKKKKVQMFGIVFMILLSTGIYTTMNTSLDRLEDRYYHYLDAQNVEHFSFVPVVNYEKDISLERLNALKENQFKEISEDDYKILSLYTTCLSKDYTPCKSEKFDYMIDHLFQKYNALDELVQNKADSIKEKYDFTYEREISKLSTEGKYSYKVISYDSEKKLNIPYIIDGKMPEKEGEITLLPNFAKVHHLKIGDMYTIGEKSYKIVGLVMAPDYIYPLLSMNSPFFDEKYNVIVYMHEKDFEKVNGVNEIVYSAVFNHKVNRNDTLKMEIVEEGEKIKSKNPATPIYENEKDKIRMDINTIIRTMRINMIQMEFETNRKFAEYFLYLLLGVSVFIIAIITKKRIEDERLQIGVLKSLGYRSSSIAISYLVYPVMGSIIGGTLGFLIGSLLNGPVSNLYVSYYNVPLHGFKMGLQYLTTSVCLPLLALSILSYLVSIYMLRRKPLDLLKEGSHLKVNLLSKFTNFITQKLSFEAKFRYSLASRSLGKLCIVSLTSFCTGLLIVLCLIGLNLFGNMIDKTFEHYKFKYQVSYTTVQTGESGDEDLIMSGSSTLLRIRKGNKEEKIDDEENLSIDAIDSTIRYIELHDEKKNDLRRYLDDDEGILVSSALADVYDVKEGDFLTLKINNKEYEFKILGVSQNFISSVIYMNRTYYNQLMGLEDSSYTVKFTDKKIYSNMKNINKEEMDMISSILSVTDLRRNIEKKLQNANGSIYVVISFAGIMAFIIIAVIANIVVEENKKTISLMKVLGYKNKEISSIVLNIYTPFVILSYLLSIPVIINLLKWIVSMLVGDMNLSIPITLSPTFAIIGLIVLVISYYIAIILSRRVLNKVPLAVALKRE